MGKVIGKAQSVFDLLQAVRLQTRQNGHNREHFNILVPLKTVGKETSQFLFCCRYDHLPEAVLHARISSTRECAGLNASLYCATALPKCLPFSWAPPHPLSLGSTFHHSLQSHQPTFLWTYHCGDACKHCQWVMPTEVKGWIHCPLWTSPS